MSRSTPPSRRAVLAAALCTLAAAAPAARAEDVSWRDDYNKARQEATEKGRPLVIDLGTENCYWCKQLDVRTFKDAALVALLNERTVPLKVDAGRNPGLADALHIQSYPTLVFAGPDGRILGYQEGFVEADRLRDQVQRTVAAVAAPPEWMERDYQEAAKARDAEDYARAVALLKNVVDDGKDRPVQARARQLLQELEQQAGARLTHARRLADKGQAAEAADVLTRLARVFAGTAAAREGGQLLATLASKPESAAARARRAKELLAQAKEDYRVQQFSCCLDRCELLAASFNDLPEAAEAVGLVADLKANPEWLKQACDQLGDRLSVLYLGLAESWLKKGQPQQATFYLERVVQLFPNTRHAEAAQVRLSQIQGMPMRSVDFKK